VGTLRQSSLRLDHVLHISSKGLIVAIITLSKVKSLLQDTGTDLDIIINDLIPVVQNYLVEHRYAVYKKTNIMIEDSDALTFDADANTITDADESFADEEFAADMDIIVEGSKANDGVHTIESVAAGTLTITSGTSLMSEAANDDYPISIYHIQWVRGIQVAVAKMIYHDIKHIKKAGISSESYGDQSLNYASGDYGDILKSVGRRMKTK